MPAALSDKDIEALFALPQKKQQMFLDSLSRQEMLTLKAAVVVYLKKKEQSSRSSTSSPQVSPAQPEQKVSKKRWVRDNAVHPTAAVAGEGLTIAGLLIETVNRAGNIMGRPTDVIPRDIVYLDYRLAEILREYGYTGYSRKKE